MCDIVHVIEVQLWDKDETEGLREIKESLNLKNFKCGNADQDVYTYNLDEKNNRDSKYSLTLVNVPISLLLSLVKETISLFKLEASAS